MMQMPDFGASGFTPGAKKKGGAPAGPQAEMMGELKKAVERRAKARKRMGLTLSEE